nr:uncharacterized protein LOC107444931 [Parasteatoda tepidariorum]
MTPVPRNEKERTTVLIYISARGKKVPPSFKIDNRWLKIDDRPSGGLKSNKIQSDGQQRVWEKRDCFTRSMFSPKTESPIVSSCFTFNSLIGKPDNISETVDNGATFSLSLDLDPTGYPPFIYQSKAQISFHNSRQIVDPYEQGFSMEMGKRYSFRLKKSIEHFGNIGGYVGMWLGISLVAVFDFLSTAFDLLKFPFRNFHVKKTRVRRINLQKRNKYEGMISVYIDLSTLEITTYNCSPKIESIEHFGNIGGYVGMWLGISLVAVFDFLSTAFDLLKFPFRNFHVKKTRVRRINLQKRNKNVNKKKPKFWSNYLTNVFRDSMLSGVPQILLAESKVKKCVLTLVFLSCIVGYLYQSSEFLRLYWKYETVVDIHLTNSNLTELPSITFCNYDGSNITKICGELKPDWCFPLSKEPELPEKVCECLPQRYCENGTFKDRKVLPFYGYGEISKLPPDERLKYIQDLNDVIRSCSFLVHGNQPEDCDFSYFRKSSVPTHNIYGFLSGCYTLNTVFGRPNAKPSVVTSSGTIVLNISIDESEYIHLYHPPEGLISFHNPYHIVNPHVKGFTLSMKTKRHTFHLKKVTVFKL